MLKFFSRRKTTPWKICGRIVLETFSFFDFEKGSNEFFTKNPQYEHLRADTITHLQYLCIAGGIIAVRIMYDAQTSGKVCDELPEFLEKAFYKNKEEKEKAFTPEQAKEIFSKVNRYLVRFNQGTNLRDLNELSAEEIYHEVSIDVADEVICDIVGKPDLETPEEVLDRLIISQVPKKRVISSDEIKLTEFLAEMIRAFISHFLNFKEIQNREIS